MDMALGHFRQRASALRRFFTFYHFTYAHLKKLKANIANNGNIRDPQVIADAKRIWAGQIFELMNVDVTVTGKENLNSEKAHLFVGNHISYLDIPLLFSILPVTFVAKEELASWPIIGSCIKSADILLVKRESAGSRQLAAKKVAEAVLQRNRDVAIFPSGTTTVDESKPWRYGAFKIAKEHQVPVQPFRLRFNPLRKAAYIDDDTFLFHFFELLQAEKIKAEIELGEPFLVEDIERDAARIQSWAQEFLKS